MEAFLLVCNFYYYTTCHRKSLKKFVAIFIDMELDIFEWIKNKFTSMGGIYKHILEKYQMLLYSLVKVKRKDGIRTLLHSNTLSPDYFVVNAWSCLFDLMNGLDN